MPTTDFINSLAAKSCTAVLGVQGLPCCLGVQGLPCCLGVQGLPCWYLQALANPRKASLALHSCLNQGKIDHLNAIYKNLQGFQGFLVTHL
jgi:hypothetical protein